METRISASVEETRITINGFTCPNCKVELNNPYVHAITKSNDKGYFQFYKTIIPKKYSDLCIFSIDQNNIQTMPVCIPPPPNSKYHTDIGPIILPPSISIKDSNAFGYTIPNSPVNVHLFKVNNRGIQIAQQAQAYSLPKYSLESSTTGFFNFNLPQSYSDEYKFFTSTSYQQQPSAKSNVLSYKLPSLFYLQWLLLPLLCLLFFYYFKKKKHKYYLAIYPKSLMIYNK
jgi:hypothetical protein